ISEVVVGRARDRSDRPGELHTFDWEVFAGDTTRDPLPAPEADPARGPDPAPDSARASGPVPDSGRACSRPRLRSRSRTRPGLAWPDPALASDPDPALNSKDQT